MARRVRDANLETRTARTALTARAKPYFKSIGPGLHLGYRKGKTGGRWLARLYDGDGKYHFEPLGLADDSMDADGAQVLDFWQAQEAAREAHTAHYTGDRPRRGRYTVADAMAEYLRWMDGTRKSFQEATYTTNAFILPTLGDVEAAKLTTKQIRAWHRKMAETPPRVRTRSGEKQRYREADTDPEAIRRRRASANRKLTTLKAALNRAFREGEVLSDKEWRRVEPFKAVDAARLRYLSVDEAQRLFNACEPSFRTLVQAALQTGARYGELAALRVEDFNPDAGTVAIRTSKSGKARHVVLTDEGVTFLEGVTAGREGADPMFKTESGDPWTKSAQARPMARACEAARINPPIGFHGLRHTWASLAVMNGVPLMVVARNLGHADTRMVEKHYGHLAPSYVADAIRAGAPRFGISAGGVVASIGSAQR